MRTKLLLRSYRDRTALSKGPRTPYSRSTPHRIPRGTRSNAFSRSTKHMWTGWANSHNNNMNLDTFWCGGKAKRVTPDFNLSRTLLLNTGGGRGGCEVSSEDSEVKACEGGWVEFTCKYPERSGKYERIDLVYPDKTTIRSTQMDVWESKNNLYHDTKNEALRVSITQLQKNNFGKYKCKFYKGPNSYDEEYEQDVELKHEDGCQRQFIKTAYKPAQTTITCDYSGNKRSSVQFFCKENGFNCEDILSTESSLKSNGTFSLTETSRGFSVSISNVSSHHAAVYWCGVKPKAGSYRAALRRIQLEVEDITTFKRSTAVGQNFTYWCEYPNDAFIKKIICKGEDPSTCQRIISTAQLNMNPVRFSIKLDKNKRNLTITVRGVTADDTGTYWCGAESSDEGRSNKFSNRLLMTVGELNETTTTPSITSTTSPDPVATSSSTPSTAAETDGVKALLFYETFCSTFYIYFKPHNRESSGWFTLVFLWSLADGSWLTYRRLLAIIVSVVCVAMLVLVLVLVFIYKRHQARPKAKGCREGWVEFTCKYPTTDKKYQDIDLVLPKGKETLQSSKKDVWEKKSSRVSLYHDTTNKHLRVAIKQLGQEDFGKYTCEFYQRSPEKVELEVETDDCQKQFIQTAYKPAQTTITCDYSGNKSSSVQFFCKENGFICEDILSTESSLKVKRDIQSHRNQQRLQHITIFERSPAVGQTFTYWCKYTTGSYTNKFICKGEDPSRCELLLNSTALPSEDTGRFSMTEDTANKNITITVRDVRTDDTGTYWCGAKSSKTPRNKFFHRFLMTVGESCCFIVQTLIEGGVTKRRPRLLFLLTRSGTTSSERHDETTGGSQLVVIVIVCVAVLLLLFVLTSILVYKRFSRSKNTQNEGTSEHVQEDYVYEEIQERVQKPDSGNAMNTIYATANFPSDPSASLHYSTINFQSGSDKAGGEALLVKPSSSACEYSAVKKSPTYWTVHQPSRSSEGPLYSTVNRSQQQVAIRQLGQEDFDDYKCEFYQRSVSSPETEEVELEVETDDCQRQFIQTAYKPAQTTITCDYSGNKSSSVQFFCKEDMVSSILQPSKGLQLLDRILHTGVNIQRIFQKIKSSVREKIHLHVSQRIISTAQHNMTSGRFSIKDDKKRNLTITVRGVTADDTGTYWCGAESSDEGRSNKFFCRLLMTVGESC
ncbi:hypothetical protein L3Q82_024392 [Scortum barcoo]|uniref:Uncharacterized protein n=1 Tax=Scortum barcoo TaxID=214431 RepID=A0ACB8WPQ5_9TELE|nr:hypothetical protein L3Q82_024392 [Scortum barcoo]